MAPIPKAEIMRKTRAQHSKLWEKIIKQLAVLNLAPETNQTADKLLAVLAGLSLASRNVAATK